MLCADGTWKEPSSTSYFLCADGTWKLGNSTSYFLRGDGTWAKMELDLVFSGKTYTTVTSGLGLNIESYGFATQNASVPYMAYNVPKGTYEIKAISKNGTVAMDSNICGVSKWSGIAVTSTEKTYTVDATSSGATGIISFTVTDKTTSASVMSGITITVRKVS